MSIEYIKGKPALPSQSKTQQPRTLATRGDDTTGVSPQKSADAGGEIKLTKESLQLHQLEKDLGKEAVVDENRVTALRKAILSGEYQIDSNRIADKLMTFEAELFKK